MKELKLNSIAYGNSIFVPIENPHILKQRVSQKYLRMNYGVISTSEVYTLEDIENSCGVDLHKMDIVKIQITRL